MSNLIWLILIFLVVVLVSSVLWLIWRLRHFSQSHNNQTVLDDKLMQSMLADEALSKELKNVLVGKTSGAGTAPSAGAAEEAEAEEQVAAPAPSPDKIQRTGRQASK